MTGPRSSARSVPVLNNAVAADLHALAAPPPRDRHSASAPRAPLWPVRPRVHIHARQHADVSGRFGLRPAGG